MDLTAKKMDGLCPYLLILLSKECSVTVYQYLELLWEYILGNVLTCFLSNSESSCLCAKYKGILGITGEKAD